MLVGSAAPAALRRAGQLGPERVRAMQESLITTSEGVRNAVEAVADTGAEELFLWPAADDPSQIERIAKAAGL